MFDEYSKVDDYLNNRLSEEDRVAFEAALDSNKQLKKVVAEHALYATIADEIINDDLSKKIKKKQNQLRAQEKPNAKLKYLMAGIVAICLIVVALIFINRKPSGEKIFAELYSPPMGSSVRGDDSNLSENIKPCYLGHEQLDQGKVELAEASFKASINDSDLMCKEKSLYYLALINVKRNKFAEAKEFISKVLEGDDGGYEQKAKDLRKHIK